MPLEQGDRIYIGIDPGLNGGLAVFLPEANEPKYFPLPESGKDLIRLIGRFVPPCGALIIVVENLHAMPGRGSIAGFKLGKSMGLCICAVDAVTLTYGPRRVSSTLISPQAWQKHYGLAKKSLPYAKRKEILRVKAVKLFPKLQLWNTTKENQRKVCDAILIANYIKEVGT